MNKLEQLKALLKESTQGRWRVEYDPFANGWNHTAVVVGKQDYPSAVIIDSLDNSCKERDMDFIAEAHNSLPSILEALEKAVEALEEPCTACELAYKQATAGGNFVYFEVCSKCQKANQALQEIHELL